MNNPWFGQKPFSHREITNSIRFKDVREVKKINQTSYKNQDKRQREDLEKFFKVILAGAMY